jgi:glycosyltransferase involved in cell wall biosynthesis
VAAWTFDVDVEPAPTEGNAIFQLQFPRSGTTLYGEQVEIIGSALGKEGPAEAVELAWHDPEHDDREVVRVSPNLPRDDTAAWLADIPHARQSGFSLLMRVPKSASAGIVISVILPDGQRVDGAFIHLRGRRHDTDTGPDTPLTSVVIPCYNQAHFLGDAIQSVHRQSYPRIETIVVDDGSSDSTADVATRLDVRCVRQENRGLPAARNRGLAESSGEYIVFLDADDRLLPHGVEANVGALEGQPEAAFVVGWAHDITSGGELIPWTNPPPIAPGRDLYAALLDDWYSVPCPASVMYRRGPLLAIGAFDESLRSAEDLDVYLRLARDHPAYAHSASISEYRQHPGTMTTNNGVMLESALATLQAERKYVRRDRTLRAAHRRGTIAMRRWYGELLAAELTAALRGRRWSEARRAMGILLRWYPRGLSSALTRLRTTHQVEGPGNGA